MATIRLTDVLGEDTSTENVMATISRVFKERFNDDITEAWVRPELFHKAIEKKATRIHLHPDSYLPADTIAVKGKSNSNTALFIY